MPLFPDLDEYAIYLSRSNEEEILSSFSPNAFELDGFEWPSIEHYFQGMKFESDKAYQAKIAKAETAKKAKQLGRSRLKRVRKDWKQVRKTIMTRGVYTCAKTHPEFAEALLETGEKTLVENNNYDYFWGCGRDRRGENTYGKVLMAVRGRLIAENKEAAKA